MGKRKTVKKPRYVVIDVDSRGIERIYWRAPGKRKVRLRGPLFSDEFWNDYAAARSGALGPKEKPAPRGAPPPAGTFARLVLEYYQSAEYRELHPDTRYRRRLVLDPVREKFGDLPAGKLTPPTILAWRDSLAGKPHAANGLIKAMRALYQFGVERGHVKTNPARNVRTIRGRKEGYHTWTADEIAQYQERWPLGTQARLALDLMLYTGVRRSDAIRLGRQHVKDGRLNFTPSKGDGDYATPLSIPIHPALAESIAATPTGDLSFLTTQAGRPWGALGAATSERVKHRAAGFGNVFKDWCVAAGLPHCSVHGLRKAAVVRLIDAGCTPHQAAAVSGHESMKVFEIYARDRNRGLLAGEAMKKLALADERSKVPPVEPVEEYGTKEAAKPLKGKRSWQSLAPRAGLEPATIRLTVECSTN